MHYHVQSGRLPFEISNLRSVISSPFSPFPPVPLFLAHSVHCCARLGGTLVARVPFSSGRINGSFVPLQFLFFAEPLFQRCFSPCATDGDKDFQTPPRTLHNRTYENDARQINRGRSRDGFGSLRSNPLASALPLSRPQISVAFGRSLA
jgi:hypothetical protein